MQHNAKRNNKPQAILPRGHSAGLVDLTSGEEQVSGLDTGAGCSAKTASV